MSRCLAFLLFDSSQPALDAAPGDGGRSPRRAALTYSLETGVVSMRHPIEGDRFSLSLRDNARLSVWEPMTGEKMGLLAAELGLWATDRRLSVQFSVVEPRLSAVVVSPQGHVMHWNDDDEVSVSDVVTLAAIPDSLLNYPDATGEWTIYARNRDGGEHSLIGGNPDFPAAVGYTQQPVVTAEASHPDSLVECGARAAKYVAALGYGEQDEHFTPEAAEFVQHHFGVDPAAVDWRDATKHRMMAAGFPTAPFDPIAACAAVRLAALSARANKAVPAPAPSHPTYTQAVAGTPARKTAR